MSVMSIAFFVLLYFYTQEFFYSRLISIYSLLFIAVFLSLNKYLFAFIARRQYIRNKIGKKTLIIGANITAENVIQFLQKNSPLHNIVGILDAYGTKKKNIGGIPVLGKMNVFEKTVDQYGIEEIIQADNIEQSLNVVNFCEMRGIEYFLSPSLSGLFHENIEAIEMEK